MKHSRVNDASTSRSSRCSATPSGGDQGRSGRFRFETCWFAFGYRIGSEIKDESEPDSRWYT